MATKLIIDGNAVYEIDEDCLEAQRKKKELPGRLKTQTEENPEPESREQKSREQKSREQKSTEQKSTEQKRIKPQR